MTKESITKAQVIDWVRSKNPQTMELKFGCRVEVHNRIGKITHMNDAGNYEVVMFGKVRTTVQERQIQKILGSDMGLQELLIAFWQWIHEGHEDDELEQATRMKVFVDMYDLTKNLHQQSEEFYQAILPLINE